MHDTSAEIDEKVREMIRAKTPLERLKMWCSIYATSRRLIERAILEQDPLISRKILKKEVFLKFYGNDFSTEECEKITSYPQVKGGGSCDSCDS